MMASLLCDASSLMSAQTTNHGERAESTIITIITLASKGDGGEPMMDATSRSKMALAFQVAAGNVKKKKKEETNGEMHKRVMEEKEAKLIRCVKKAAKTMIKKKQIKKLTAYFGKK